MNAPLRVLFVEDSENDCVLLQNELTRGGYKLIAERVDTADAMGTALERQAWDLVISDHRMPQFSSIGALKLYKEHGRDVPFIVVSGSIGEELAVSAMKAGAHDYIMKDNLNRLLPAVERELREAESRRRRVSAEQTAEKFRTRIESILDAAGEGVCGLDAAGIITFINPRGAKLLGWTVEELIGKPLHETVHHSRADQTTFLKQDCSLCATLRDGLAHWMDDEVFWRKDEQPFPIEYTCTPMRVDGKVCGAVLTFQDITQRKGAEAALKESNRRLENALTELRQTQRQLIQQERLSALGQMASGVAHDFNNSLSKMMGLTELLLTSPGKLSDHGRVRESLQMISTAAHDAAHVVRRLREFYRPRQDNEPFRTVNVNDVLEGVIPLTEPKWKRLAQASGAPIEICKELSPVPPIMADEAELRELLTNLIFNAVDAMPQGGTLTFRTSMDNDRVVIQISDTGRGMPAEVLEHCFEPFFTTKGEAGTGLGLAMAYGIVQRHGGDIQVQSQVDQGTTLTIRLPISVDQKIIPPPRQPAVVPGGQLRVLVVEDEPMIREIETEYLTADGHIVETAADGREGLRKFCESRFDIVLADRAMPEMNGEQLAEAIKGVAPRTPVILITGFSDGVESPGQKAPRVDLIMAKPFTQSALREAVSKVTVSAQAVTAESKTKNPQGVS